ncbi:hypothetical protein HD554DRAFT_2331316 [Boletus coccyginus]|nr:hypothetical protein HD554DRAFT_2331316 [Boletus coccyginus]
MTFLCASGCGFVILRLHLLQLILSDTLLLKNRDLPGKLHKVTPRAPATREPFLLQYALPERFASGARQRYRNLQAVLDPSYELDNTYHKIPAIPQNRNTEISLSLHRSKRDAFSGVFRVDWYPFRRISVKRWGTMTVGRWVSNFY